MRRIARWFAFVAGLLADRATLNAPIAAGQIQLIQRQASERLIE